MIELKKLSATYKTAVTRGQIELACALQPLLLTSDEGSIYPG